MNNVYQRPLQFTCVNVSKADKFTSDYMSDSTPLMCMMSVVLVEEKIPLQWLPSCCIDGILCEFQCKGKAETNLNKNNASTTKVHTMAQAAVCTYKMCKLELCYPLLR